MHVIGLPGTDISQRNLFSFQVGDAMDCKDTAFMLCIQYTPPTEHLSRIKSRSKSAKNIVCDVIMASLS